jgi:hypothetical protein
VGDIESTSAVKEEGDVSIVAVASTHVPGALGSGAESDGRVFVLTSDNVLLVLRRAGFNYGAWERVSAVPVSSTLDGAVQGVWVADMGGTGAVDVFVWDAECISPWQEQHSTGGFVFTALTSSICPDSSQQLTQVITASLTPAAGDSPGAYSRNLIAVAGS